MEQLRVGVHSPRSTGEFQAWFRTDEDCLDYLEWLRWPGGFICPRCGHGTGWRLGDGRLECAGCSSRTSVTAGTMFDMIRLQHWTMATIASRDEPGERQLLHRYAIWHALRRLRRRAGSEHITHGQAVTVRRHVRAAITLLDWLTGRGLDLGTARQGDLDTWLTGDHATPHGDAGNFVRWARRQKLTSLDFAATRWDGPSGIIDTEARWHHARRLLHDDTIKPEDRVAGLLVLPYAQGPAVISRLTLDQVHAGQQHVRLRLGREPVVLPGPLGALILQLAASRRGHAALGDQGTSPWLFPSGQPGQPISAYRLAERLRQLGLRPARHARPPCSASPPNSPQPC